MDLIVLGVDGVAPDYLEDALEKRDMPNWERLKQGSFYSDLPSTVPSITVPAWQCMFSGYNPGRFDAFNMNMPDYDEMDVKPVRSGRFRGDFFWDKIQGSVSLHHIPGTAPVYEVNGFMRSGFPSPGMSLYPEDLEEEVSEVYDDLDLGNPVSSKERVKDDFRQYENELNISRLMMEKDTDVFVSVIRMTDSVGHHADRKARILDAYEKTDEFLGEVMEKAEEEDASLLVVSDHGFLHAERKFNVQRFLEKKGLLEFNVDNKGSSLVYKMAQPLLKTPLRSFLKSVHGLLNHYTDVSFNDRYHNFLSQLEPDSKVLPSWKPVGRELGLKINTEDMPNGEVSEEEKEQILQELEEELENLEDSGRKVVEKIWRGEELYDESENMPDLVFRSTEDFIPDVLTSDMMFVNTSSFTHDVNGIFFAQGPGIDEDAEEDLEIFDVAPLIYALLGEDIPDDLDAELPENLLDESIDVEYVSDELKGLDF